MTAYITPAIAYLAAAAILASAAYIGISRDLCRQELADTDYAAMRLDCKAWYYR